jgi:4-amino-4-deoxy-L-arabinose transferase-like glycosyltransferase
MVVGEIGKRSWIAAIVSALVVRLGCLALLDFRPNAGDSVGYLTLANGIRRYHVFSMDSAPPLQPTTFRAPGFPAFVAGLQSLFGEHIFPVQVVQILISSTVPILLALALVPTASPRVARMALWLTALSPYDAIYGWTILSEALCTFLLVLGLTLPLLARSRWAWLGAGACLGLAALTRDIYLALIPGLAIALCLPYALGAWVRSRGQSPLSAAVFLILGSVVVVAPWTARNYSVTGKFIPVSKGILGQNLWIGTWEVDGKWLKTGWLQSLPPEACRNADECRLVESIAAKDETVRTEELMKLAIRRIREEPRRVFGRWLLRAPRMWFGTRLDTCRFRPAFLAPWRPAWVLVKSASFCLNGTLVLLGAAGLFTTVRRSPVLRWLALPILYNFFVFLPIHSTEPRYSQPVYSILLVFAAVVLLSIWDATTQYRAKRRRVSTSSNDHLRPAPS